MDTKKWTILGILSSLVLLLALFFVPSAFAGETRSGGTIEIKQGEVVADDLYVFADTLLVNGVVQGDLLSFASRVVVGPTGVIEGDLISAGRSIEINGKVKDDARVAGAAILLGYTAQVGDDLMAAGFSLETADGSQVGGSLTFAGYQALLAGDVAGDLTFSGNSLNLQGSVGGDAEVEAGGGEVNMPINPFTFIPNMPSVPTVPSGLTFGPEASIGGSLAYEAPKEAEIPEGAVEGEVDFTQIVVPVATPAAGEAPGGTVVQTAQRQTAAVTQWVKTFLSRLVSLLIVGLLLAWLYPRVLSGSVAALKSKPWASLGGGFLTSVVFWLGMPLLSFILLGIIFLVGLVSLGGLAGVAFMIALLIVLALGLAFLLSGSFFSKLIISQWLGRLILAGFKSPAAEHRFWPWLLGLVIYVLLWSIPFVGWMINFVAVLFGLGAFILWLAGLRQGAQPSI